MTEEIGTIKFSRTDNGIRIDVAGDVMRQMCCCCCAPSGKDGDSDCCAPSDKK